MTNPARIARGWLAEGRAGVLIEILDVQGSAPRGPGAAMAIAADALAGTIGGGALEWAMIARARARLGATGEEVTEIALGPEIGQCCGGRARLRLSPLTEANVDALTAPDGPAVLIFGAGHVGAALARALAPLPVRVSVFDERPDLIAPLAAEGIDARAAALAEAEIAAAPPGAAYVATTHDHALDFLVVEAALARGDAAYVGMIGSATKRAVAERSLREAGVDPAGLTCPIGAKLADKRPEVIAAMAAAEIASALL